MDYAYGEGEAERRQFRGMQYRKKPDMAEKFSARFRQIPVKDTLVQVNWNKGYDNTDAVLCPFLPSVKRNLKNQMPAFLIGKEVTNKTLFVDPDTYKRRKDENVSTHWR